MTSSADDQMYLTDDPIKSKEEDSFGHTEYVDTLSEIIKNVGHHGILEFSANGDPERVQSSICCITG